ncbi:hypothetical protein ACFLTQ_01065 [Chloroflexota bacterium]
MAGKKGRSGRRKNEGTLIKEGLAIIEENYPDLVRALIHKAIIQLPVTCPHCNEEFTIPGGGSESSIHYAIDRILGKPKQAIEQKTDVEISVSPELLIEQRGKIQEWEQRVLNGDYAVLESLNEYNL